MEIIVFLIQSLQLLVARVQTMAQQVHQLAVQVVVELMVTQLLVQELLIKVMQVEIMAETKKPVAVVVVQVQ